MAKRSELNVCTKYNSLYYSSALYDAADHNPSKYGCLDTRLGVCDKNKECATCHQKVSDCAGHFGHIELALPVFHIGYLTTVIEILRCVCKVYSLIINSIEMFSYLITRATKNKNTQYNA